MRARRIGVVRHLRKLRGHVVADRLGVIHRAAEHGMERVQLVLQFLQTVAGGLQRNIRRHLADQTAHVLAPLDLAAVFAVADIAALPPGDAADVVAHVRIADRAVILAALQHARGMPGDAAGVGQGAGLVVDAPVFEQIVDRAVKIAQFFNIEFFIGHARIHGGKIRAVHHAARVFAHDAAGKALTLNDARHAAGRDDAAGLVQARDAAHLLRGDDRPGKDAGVDAPVVLRRDAAHRALRAGRRDAPLHAQAFHRAAALDAAEQRQPRVAGRQVEPPDGMAAAVKRAQKDGDVHRRVLKVNIVRQNGRQAARVAVGRTLCRKVRKLFCASDAHLAVCRQPRGAQAQKQRQQDQNCPGAPGSVTLIHRRFPPLPQNLPEHPPAAHRPARRRCPRAAWPAPAAPHCRR